MLVFLEILTVTHIENILFFQKIENFFDVHINLTRLELKYKKIRIDLMDININTTNAWWCQISLITWIKSFQGQLSVLESCPLYTMSVLEGFRCITIEHKNSTDLFHISHDRKFLCINETFKHNTNRHIHIVFVYVLTKMHSRMRFSHSNHGLDVTYCDRDATSDLKKSKMIIFIIMKGWISQTVRNINPRQSLKYR